MTPTGNPNPGFKWPVAVVQPIVQKGARHSILVPIWHTMLSSLDVAEAPKLVEDPLFLAVGSRAEGGVLG